MHDIDNLNSAVSLQEKDDASELQQQSIALKEQVLYKMSDNARMILTT